jgi:hypothetical protein
MARQGAGGERIRLEDRLLPSPALSRRRTHGSAELQRGLIEPVFLKYGVNVVFTGHEHFYERIKPQKGVAYFIIGSSSKLRRGDLEKSALTVYGNDSDYAFMLVEIAGDELYFPDHQRQGRHDRHRQHPARRRRRSRIGRHHAAGGAAGKPSPVQPGPDKPK